MPTFRDLYDKLATLNPEQLDCEIKVIPVGFTDSDAAAILRYDVIPEVLEITKAPRDLYHCKPSGEDSEWMEPSICDFSEDEVKEMEIDTDPDYTLICHKGEMILKIKDGVEIIPSEEAHLGNLDTSIMKL
ncbi:MAG: hypothetical protein MJY91_02810 [Bacteroidales bacterium]|nr:hypothetical protein [Bacteroidales bacterium]